MTTRPAVRLVDAGLSFPGRTLWSGLTMSVQPGEFVAVLGPNGSGKSSLLKVLLGRLRLSTGAAEVAGGPDAVGYVPQQGAVETGDRKSVV